MTKQEYGKLSDSVSPKSPLLKDIGYAFLIGGLICVIGQFFIEFYKNFGVSETDSPVITSITLVFLSALLTGFNVYDNIAKIGGAGTLVPITGFANAMVSPAIEFKSEGLILGLGAKMFAIAGPVIVYGISASVLYGLIIYFFHLY